MGIPAHRAAAKNGRLATIHPMQRPLFRWRGRLGTVHNGGVLAERTLVSASRDQCLAMPDDRLLDACRVETYRASGPGGQHRNKRDSAVRLTHEPTGVRVTATERRSQHENRRVAVHRLRKAIALQVRAPADPTAPPTGSLATALAEARWPRLKIESEPWLLAAAHVLDRLESAEGKVSDAAAGLGVSTASLGKFLSLDSDLWQEANRLRRRFGHAPLRRG